MKSKTRRGVHIALAIILISFLGIVTVTVVSAKKMRNAVIDTLASAAHAEQNCYQERGGYCSSLDELTEYGYAPSRYVDVQINGADKSRFCITGKYVKDYSGVYKVTTSSILPVLTTSLEDC